MKSLTFPVVWSRSWEAWVVSKQGAIRASAFLFRALVRSREMVRSLRESRTGLVTQQL